MTLTLLDLCCGVGGASVGYYRAGWEVKGWDINPQPDYPFEFHQGDALSLDPEWIAENFDAVHASWPCQAYLTGTLRQDDSPRLTEPGREMMAATGLPYVIENPAARADVVLCGEMFGLRVLRHRNFELGNWKALQPDHPPHRGGVAGYVSKSRATASKPAGWNDGYYFGVYGTGGGKGSVPQWQNAMGIDWTNNRKSIAEAIPPAYTEHIGRSLSSYLTLTPGDS